jgi:hypothetical protein
MTSEREKAAERENRRVQRAKREVTRPLTNKQAKQGFLGPCDSDPRGPKGK